MKELSVVVVDDSVLVREHLKRAFALVDGCTLIGMAADGEEALTIIRALVPDIVVLDISMPHRNGIEVLREIRTEDSEIMIIMFTSDPSVILKAVCLEAGANYYLDKTQIHELIDICTNQVKKEQKV